MPPALEGDVKAAGLVLRLLERRAKALALTPPSRCMWFSIVTAT
jgi:hypothetical protein